MAGFLQRGVLLYLCLAIAMCFAAPEVVFDQNTPQGRNVLEWFNIDYNNQTGVIGINNQTSFVHDEYMDNATAGMDNPTPPSSSGSVLGWLDPLFQVFGWIKLFFRMIFSPILLMVDPRVSMPVPIILIIGIPLVVMFIIGIISWIRSGIA